jgi:hypothetical protein
MGSGAGAASAELPLAEGVTDVLARASSRVEKLGMMRSRPLIAKTRRTAVAEMTTLNHEPGLRHLRHLP